MFTFQFISDKIDQNTKVKKWTTLFGGLGPGICVKYFLSFPQNNLSPEKTETNEVFTFQFLSDKICQIAKCQMAFYGINVNFITPKSKSKHLVCLSFLW